MNYQFAFRPYQHPFRQPLITSHGIWKVREGIIIRLTDNVGRVGWGEIAPLPWFGSETLTEAVAFCRHLDEKVTEEIIAAIPPQLSASQFAFESALFSLSPRLPVSPSPRQGYSHLLPTGEVALTAWKVAWDKGGRTFKWKIGVSAIEEEIKLCEKLVRILPTGGKLRLDANGGLSWDEANDWLKICDRLGIVEFVEQPLAPQQLDLMLELSGKYSTPVALDESVATLVQLQECYQRGWRGIFIIKAAIAGSPQRLRQFCRQYQIDAVFSSVFETSIGRKAALCLAAELSHPNRALGFGVNHWFRENEENWLKNLWNNP